MFLWHFWDFQRAVDIMKKRTSHLAKISYYGIFGESIHFLDTTNTEAGPFVRSVGTKKFIVIERCDIFCSSCSSY